MKMYLNDGKRDVEDVEVTLKEALEEVEKHPPCSDEVDSFIGFTRSEEEICQFVRMGEENWAIDIPVFKKGVCKYTLQEFDLPTKTVREVLIRFFGNHDNWRDGLKLHKSWWVFWKWDTIGEVVGLGFGVFILFFVTYLFYLPLCVSILSSSWMCWFSS